MIYKYIKMLISKFGFKNKSRQKYKDFDTNVLFRNSV